MGPVVGVVNASNVHTVLVDRRLYEIAVADIHTGMIDIVVVALEVDTIAGNPLGYIGRRDWNPYLGLFVCGPWKR